MHLTLRSPIRQDYDALASWIPDANACAHWAGPLLKFPFSPTELPSFLSGPGACSYSLSETDRPTRLLGFGQLIAKAPGTLHLARIVVSPQHRRTGVGRALGRLLLDEAMKFDGVRRLTLNVYRNNQNAIGLYLSLGFVESQSPSRPELISMEKVFSTLGHAGI